MVVVEHVHSGVLRSRRDQSVCEGNAMSTRPTCCQVAQRSDRGTLSRDGNGHLAQERLLGLEGGELLGVA
jgi:hypothetical protein